MKTIKTLAFASLVAFSTLAFTACNNSGSTNEATADTTAVTPEDLIQDETTNSVDDGSMMEAQQDTTAADSTGM